MSELRRELSLLDSTMINAGTMIGSAIFLVPSTIAVYLAAPSLALVVWVTGGIISLLGALCLAELGAALPRAGGQFVYLEEAYGPVWGFLYGWAAAIVINPAAVAAIAVGFATYVGFFVPLDGWLLKAVAVASIVALTVLNCLGLRPGAFTQNLLTGLKIAALGALVVLAFALPGGSGAHFVPFLPTEAPASLIAPFGLAMVAVLWAYDGWIEITYVGGEVKDPGRNIPRSIVWSLVIVVALYTVVNLAYLYLLPQEEIARSSVVASDAVRVVLGAAGAAFVALTIIVSTLGSNNGIVLTAARIPYAMARSRLFFQWAGRVHPRFRTPAAALAAQGVVASLLALSGTYQQLFTYVIFASWVFYALSCAAVIRLRHSAPQLERPYRTWGYPWTPVIFIGFAVWLVANTIAEAPWESAIGAGIVLAGLPAYWYWSRGKGEGEPVGR